jgi:hypothetical protein
MDAMRLELHGRTLELRTGRAGVRTTARLLVDSSPVAAGSGLGRVLLHLPTEDGPAPAVLALAPLPGVVVRAVLLEPAPAASEPAAGPEDAEVPERARALLDLATARRHPFDPAPGTLAARLHALRERHPRLWAARHVALGVGKVLAGLLGIAVLLQALVRPLLRWLTGLLPGVELPDLPLPDIGLPWPEIHLPEVSVPAWVATLLATAKFWGPVVVGVVLAVREIRRRRRSGAGDEPAAEPGDDAADAHR